MSYSLRTKLNVGLLLLMFACLFAFSANPVSAQESTEESNQNSSTFVYRAEAGDNLTQFVRKSIALYASNNEVELSDGQAIAAETWIVQDMGAYELNVGQEVTVEESAVADAVSRANGLEQAVANRWAAYGITRDVDVQPVSAPSYVGTDDLKVEEEPTTNDSTNDEVATETEGGSDENQDVGSTDSTSETTESNDSDDAPWYWWLIGALAIAALWYVLGGNEAVKNRRKK